MNTVIQEKDSNPPKSNVQRRAEQVNAISGRTQAAMVLDHENRIKRLEAVIATILDHNSHIAVPTV